MQSSYNSYIDCLKKLTSIKALVSAYIIIHFVKLDFAKYGLITEEPNVVYIRQIAMYHHASVRVREVIELWV